MSHFTKNSLGGELAKGGKTEKDASFLTKYILAIEYFMALWFYTH